MRRGYSNSKFIEEGDTFYGISLGSDFTAEHEWGTETLQRKLGVNKEKKGLAGRLISTKDNTVIFMIENNDAILITKHWSYSDDRNKELTFKELLNRELIIYKENEYLATAWDDSSFGIHVKGEENIVKLEKLYNAFKTNNVALTYIKSDISAFSNSSLSLLIADQLPKEITDGMTNVDKKRDDLIAYENEIGITALKEKAKATSRTNNKEKYFMACSPRWIDYEDSEMRTARKKEMNTKYDIHYWINYSDDDNNYGWYIAEEIIQWLSTPGLKLTQIRKGH